MLEDKLWKSRPLRYKPAAAMEIKSASHGQRQRLARDAGVRRGGAEGTGQRVAGQAMVCALGSYA